MFLITPVLAEVSDKMMSLPALLAWAAGLSVTAWFLSRKKKWLILVPLPLALLFALGSLEEMRDPFFASAVIRELGYSYWIVSLIPLIAIVAIACISKKPIQPPQTTTGSSAPSRV